MSTRSLGTLTLDIIAKTGLFTGPLDKAGRDAENTAKRIDKAFKDIGNAAMIVSGVLATALTVAMTKVVAETIQAEKEQAQLAAVLKSTGQAAGFTRDQLNEMADSMERTSTKSAGEINEAQTTLLAFTNIVGTQFTSALQAAVDMSSRTGMSVVSAAETIGRALDVPSQGMAALSRQGFKWSESQKELIKELESTGKRAEAQKIILDALEDTYGGAAQAARNTFGGALEALGNALDAVSTGSDGSLTGATEAVLKLTDTLNDPEVRRGIAVLADGLISIANGAVGAAAKLGEVIAHIPSFVSFLTGNYDVNDIGQVSVRFEEINEQLEKYNRNSRYMSRERALELQEEGKMLARIINQYNAAATVAATNAKFNEEQAAARANAAAAEAEAEAKKEAAAKAAADAAKKAAEEAARAEEARKKRIADTIKDLETQVTTLGMNSQELVAYKLAADGATEADIKRAQALRRVLDEQEFLAKWMDSNIGAEVAAEFVKEENEEKEKAQKRLEELQAMFDTEREQEIARYEQQLEDFEEYVEARELSEEEARIRREELEKEHEDRMGDIKEKGRKSTINTMQDMYRLMSTLMNSENRKLFELGKAAALANGLVSAYESVIDSYKFGAKLGGPVLGAAFATAAGIAQFAQLDAIRSASFGGGGSAAAPSVTQALNANATPVDAGGSGRNVYVHGIDPGSLFTGQQLVDLVNGAVEDGAVLRVAA